MADRTAHVAAWKERLQRALTADARSTSELAKATAVPLPQARRLLTELRDDGLAVKTYLPRLMAGAGTSPVGWRLRESV